MAEIKEIHLAPHALMSLINGHHAYDESGEVFIHPLEIRPHLGGGTKHGAGYFIITSVHRNDVELAVRLHGDKSLAEYAKELTDADMERLASKMADDYVTQMFWSSCAILADDRLYEIRADLQSKFERDL